MKAQAWLAMAGMIGALTGCGRDGLLPLGQTPGSGAGPDAGVSDGAVDDGGQADATVTDGGFPPLDAGFGPDAALPDTGGFPDAFVPMDATVVDTGFPDTGIIVPDTGVPDAFVPPNDAGFPDAVVPVDAGFPFDAGFPDTGFPDTGAIPDVGFPDANVPDVGFGDTGVVPDAGTPDTGVVPDAGSVPDSGVPCPMGCAFLDNACNVGTCAADGVTCVRTPRPSGTACDDGNACTVGDSCQLGACQSGGPRDCSALDGPCATGICSPQANGCVAQAEPDGTMCDDGNACTVAVCAAGACVATPNPTPVPGDTCATPITIPLQPGPPVVQSGNTTCAADDSTGSCALGVGGNDVVFSLDPGNVTRRVVATTMAPMMGTPFDTVLHLRRSCTSSFGEVACDNDTAGMGFSTLDAFLTRRPNFLFVDGTSAAASGDYEVMFEVDPHDTCGNPARLEFPQTNQTIIARGNTTGMVNTFEATCGGFQQSPDHVWQLDVPTQSILRIETTNPGIGQYDTALHVRSSTCTTDRASVIACDDDGGQGTLSRIERSFAPGTYFIVVDGFGNNQQGEYLLRVSQVPPVEVFPFPSTGDARLPLTGPFSQAGNFVEGIRDPITTQVRRVELNLQITNRLTCSSANVLVRLNNQTAGNFFIRPGDTVFSGTLNPPNTIFGTQFNIRYEVQNSIPGGCGDFSLPDGVSTIGLGN